MKKKSYINMIDLKLTLKKLYKEIDLKNTYF